MPPNVKNAGLVWLYFCSLIVRLFSQSTYDPENCRKNFERLTKHIKRRTHNRLSTICSEWRERHLKRRKRTTLATVFLRSGRFAIAVSRSKGYLCRWWRAGGRRPPRRSTVSLEVLLLWVRNETHGWCDMNSRVFWTACECYRTLRTSKEFLRHSNN